MHSRRNNTRRIYVIGALFFFGAAVFFMRAPLLEGVRSALLGTGEDIWSMQNTFISLSAPVAAVFTDRKELVEEKEALQDKLDSMELEQLSLSVLRKENAELKELLNRDTRQEYTLATVLSRPRFTVYDMLVIDVGAEDGVKRGDMVLWPENIVLGTVTHTSAHAATVSLFSSSGSVREAFLEGEENIRVEEEGITQESTSVSVEVQGQGGGNFLIQLPRDIDVSSGDMILIPHITPRILARVEYIEADSTQPFQRIYARTPINIQELKWVLVVSPQEPSL